MSNYDMYPRMAKVLMLKVIMIMTVLVEMAAASCSSSCLVQEDIISCRHFDHPADVRSCARHHPTASVLDLSYISIRHPLTRRSLAGLQHIVVLYIDGSSVQSVDADALTGMGRLRMVFARRMRSPLTPLLDAMIAAPSLRQVALAGNFVVCSCSWLHVVQRLSAVDIVIVDMLDAAPRCSQETIRRCCGNHSGADDDRRSNAEHRRYRRRLRMGRHHHRHRSFTGGRRHRRYRYRHRQRAAKTSASPETDEETPASPETGGKTPASPATGGKTPMSPATGGKTSPSPETGDKKQKKPGKPGSTTTPGDTEDTETSGATKTTGASKTKETSGTTMSGLEWVTHPGTIALLVLLFLVIILIIIFFGTPLKHKLVQNKDSKSKKSKKSGSIFGRRSTVKKGRGSERYDKKRNIAKPESTPESQLVEGSTLEQKPPSSSTQPESKPVEDVATGEKKPLIPPPEGASNVNQSQFISDEGEDRRRSIRNSIRELFARRMSALRHQNLGKSNNRNNATSSEDELSDSSSDY